ncbi:hypothetical protein PR048_007639 [Dryococelus australis]|uniref:Maturase K n=1 Tax=Dryococelus australis TaxID=614101 RepID=A0ABQ9HUT2_9NEOP|nr:hypothetical protein PR048_007639 [Dryococelus australis]
MVIYRHNGRMVAETSASHWRHRLTVGRLPSDILSPSGSPARISAPAGENRCRRSCGSGQVSTRNNQVHPSLGITLPRDLGSRAGTGISTIRRLKKLGTTYDKSRHWLAQLARADRNASVQKITRQSGASSDWKGTLHATKRGYRRPDIPISIFISWRWPNEERASAPTYTTLYRARCLTYPASITGRVEEVSANRFARRLPRPGSVFKGVINAGRPPKAWSNLYCKNGSDTSLSTLITACVRVMRRPPLQLLALLQSAVIRDGLETLRFARRRGIGEGKNPGRPHIIILSLLQASSGSYSSPRVLMHSSLHSSDITSFRIFTPRTPRPPLPRYLQSSVPFTSPDYRTQLIASHKNTANSPAVACIYKGRWLSPRNFSKCRVALRVLVSRIFSHVLIARRLLQQGERGGAVTPAGPQLSIISSPTHASDGAACTSAWGGEGKVGHPAQSRVHEYELQRPRNSVLEKRCSKGGHGVKQGQCRLSSPIIFSIIVTVSGGNFMLSSPAGPASGRKRMSVDRKTGGSPWRAFRRTLYRVAHSPDGFLAASIKYVYQRGSIVSQMCGSTLPLLDTSIKESRARGGVVVRLLASHLGEPGLDSQRGRSRIFACGNRAVRCRSLAGFFVLGYLPFSPHFHPDTAPYSPRSESPKSLHSVTQCHILRKGHLRSSFLWIHHHTLHRNSLRFITFEFVVAEICGDAVVEWPVHRPPTTAAVVRFLAGSRAGFRAWNTWRTLLFVGGYRRDTPASLALERLGHSIFCSRFMSPYRNDGRILVPPRKPFTLWSIESTIELTRLIFRTRANSNNHRSLFERTEPKFSKSDQVNRTILRKRLLSCARSTASSRLLPVFARSRAGPTCDV